MVSHAEERTTSNILVMNVQFLKASSSLLSDGFYPNEKILKYILCSKVVHCENIKTLIMF